MKRLLLAIAACAHAPAAKPQTLADGAAIALPNAEQVVELGDALFVLSSHAIAIVRGGAVVANVPAPVGFWGTATTIPALDGEGRWVVATDLEHNIYRVRATGELESLGDQLGVARASQIHGAGSTFGLEVDGGIAISTDGVHLVRYQTPGALAVAQGRIAVATTSSVEVWDLAHGSRTSYSIAQGHPAFLDADRAPRLVVATPTSLYVEDAGKLERIPAPHEPHAIIAGAKLWIASGGALYVFDGAGLVKTTTPVPRAARVFGARDGTVWIADGLQLASHSLEARVDDPRWRAEIEPVFQRVCAHCHLPGGSADVDLSTAAAWTATHAEIGRRVLLTRTMPPAGTDLSEADRAAIAHWLR